MFNSGILDVVLGLIFIYLLLSLVCTAINEFIEAGLKRRAIYLERGIRELLRVKQTDCVPPQNTPPESGLKQRIMDFGKRTLEALKLKQKDDGQYNYELVSKLYKHPLVFSLFEGDYEPKKTKKNLPSYIPAKNFALALINIVMTDTKTEGSAIKDLRDAIGKIQNFDEVRDALIALVDAAGDDIDKARKNIEDWFDSCMDRVSGWFTRYTRVITIVVATVVAVAVNVDTINIATRLSTDVTMRESLVLAAQEYAKSSAAPDAPNDSLSDVAWVPVDCTTPECRVQKNLDEISKLGLPIGWKVSEIPNTFSGWLSRILGWALTTFAISLGAPFWFDMLNNIMTVRSTIKPKEKSPEEPPLNKKENELILKMRTDAKQG